MTKLTALSSRSKTRTKADYTRFLSPKPPSINLFGARMPIDAYCLLAKEHGVQ